jgi:Arm DNA-binding domain
MLAPGITSIRATAFSSLEEGPIPPNGSWRYWALAFPTPGRASAFCWRLIRGGHEESAARRKLKIGWRSTSSSRDVPDALVPGLYLAVKPSGVKSWCVRYRFEGRQRRYTIGRAALLDVSVATTALADRSPETNVNLGSHSAIQAALVGRVTSMSPGLQEAHERGPDGGGATFIQAMGVLAIMA